jgi:hypothetical protein
VPLTLPAPFASLPAGAWTQYGRRYVSLGPLDEPGRLHRNDYEIAWFEVYESSPWSGEARHVHASRRRPNAASIVRVPFTDAGTRSIERTVLPVVNRYGFHRWWTEILAGRNDREASTALVRSADLDNRARWHRDRSELWSLLGEGLLDLVAVPPARRGRDERRVLALDPADDRPRWETVEAEALLAGEVVGYYTREGKLVPLDAGIRLS